MTMTPEAALALRKPFPPESIGKLPKGGVDLDFVGHAAVTDRLLTVDPEWSWEPLALDAAGLPALDKSGNLWIKLTICGVTRLGVGDGKSAKELVGDAIRNSAMRFGVALDLWTKQDLVEFAHAATARQTRPAAVEPTATMADLMTAAERDWRAEADALTARADLRALWTAAHRAGAEPAVLDHISECAGRAA